MFSFFATSIQVILSQEDNLARRLGQITGYLIMIVVVIIVARMILKK